MAEMEEVESFKDAIAFRGDAEGGEVVVVDGGLEAVVVVVTVTVDDGVDDVEAVDERLDDSRGTREADREEAAEVAVITDLVLLVVIVLSAAELPGGTDAAETVNGLLDAVFKGFEDVESFVDVDFFEGDREGSVDAPLEEPVVEYLPVVD